MVDKVVTANLNFGETAQVISPSGVNLNFGNTVGIGEILQPRAFEDGQSLAASLVISSPLGSVYLATGESLGTSTPQLKDRRNYPSVLAADFPVNQGLAFLSSANASWPSGYVFAPPYVHFYATGGGTPLTTAEPQTLSLPAFTLAEIFGAGNGSYPVYAVQQSPISISQGESLEASLKAGQVGLGHQYGDGQQVLLSVFTDIRFAIEGSHGEVLAVDIALAGNNIYCQTGESCTASLNTTDLGRGQVWDGQALQGALATSQLLQFTSAEGQALDVGVEFHAATYVEASAAQGEQLSADLNTRPISYLQVQLGYGQQLTTTLNVLTNHRLSVAFSAGESIQGEVEKAARQDLSISFLAGESVALETFSTACSFGLIQLGEGSSSIVAYMDEVEPFRFPQGEALHAEVQFTAGFGNKSEDGASLFTQLDTRPAQSLAITAYAGETLYANDLKTKVFAPLVMTFFSGEFITVTESTATTSFDLADNLHVDSLDWWVATNLFEFEDYPPAFQFNKGAATVVTAELSCRPRFTIAAATGEAFSTQAGSRFLDVSNFRYGLSSATGAKTEFFYIEPVINLCYPNLFPNADAMEVELDFAEITCYADYLYSGEYFRAGLSATKTLWPMTLGESSRLDFDLTIYDLWRVQFWPGEHFSFYLTTEDKLRPYTYGHGESMSITMEEPSALCFAGESVSLNLTLVFEVEFLERGCLDNQFIYTNENGDPDVSKFNPVAVEEEPFLHEILARCK